MKRVANLLSLLVVLAMTAYVAGCDSSSELDGEPLSPETAAAMSETVSNLFEVLPLALAEVPIAKSLSPSSAGGPAGACPDGGSLTVEGTATGGQSSFDIDVDVDFNDCNGINGSLALAGSGSFTESQVAFDLILDGSVSRECSLTFERFHEGIFADFTTGAATLTLDGVYRGACSGEGFTCAFNDVEIDANAAPPSGILEQSCRLN